MKYTVEMSYGIGFTVTDIEANSQDEAIEKAKEIVEEEITVVDGRNVDSSDLEFEDVNFVIGE
ncbi:MAG TPA: hypothetical protein VK190_02410 [Pseudoneobacillus sp.]|nr:hypothetical protein [Pseudoneobacillus sp.]